MYYLIYSSYSAVDFDSEELESMLIRFRKNNQQHSITGMLLYVGSQFVQLLEGGETEVKAMYQNICNDGRHKGVIMLDENYTEKRIFPEWLMGFKALNAEELQNIAGYQKVNSASALTLLKQLSVP